MGLRMWDRVSNRQHGIGTVVGYTGPAEKGQTVWMHRKKKELKEVVYDQPSGPEKSLVHDADGVSYLVENRHLSFDPDCLGGTAVGSGPAKALVDFLDFEETWMSAHCLEPATEEQLSEALKDRPAPMTRKEKRRSARSFAHRTPKQVAPEFVYALAGWLSQAGNVQLLTSAPPDQYQEAWEAVSEAQRSEPRGLTAKSEGSAGTCYDILVRKPEGTDLEALAMLMGIEFDDYRCEKKNPFLLLYGRRADWFFFLLDHGFKDGKGPQDAAAIRASVPAESLAHFDAGTQGRFTVQPPAKVQKTSLSSGI